MTDINQCSDTILATVGVQVGLAEISSNDVQIKLQPNPVNELLHLEIQGLKGPSNLEIQVYNVAGKVVRHAKIPAYGDVYTGTVVFADQPAGIYFIRIVNANFKKLIRVVKS